MGRYSVGKGTIRRLVAVATTAIAALAIGFGAAPSAVQAAPTWAPAASAPIHPGVMMFTDGAQCTANFIFTNAADVFIGYAAHCAGTGGATETNGCDSGSLPLGTPVEIDRSEEHTSELQSLMRISYAVFCLKKKTYLKHKPPQ